jgi:hypothetical protein
MTIREVLYTAIQHCAGIHKATHSQQQNVEGPHPLHDAYLDRAVLAFVEVVGVAVAVLVFLVGNFVRLVSPVAERLCVKSVV